MGRRRRAPPPLSSIHHTQQISMAAVASTHTALVSQSLVGLCFAFPSINQSPLTADWLGLALTTNGTAGDGPLRVVKEAGERRGFRGALRYF